MSVFKNKPNPFQWLETPHCVPLPKDAYLRSNYLYFRQAGLVAHKAFEKARCAEGYRYSKRFHDLSGAVRNGKRFIENPENNGLRLVAKTRSSSADDFDDRKVYGVVYQLPSKGGKVRLIAGTMTSDDTPDSGQYGVYLDFSTIEIEPASDYCDSFSTWFEDCAAYSWAEDMAGDSAEDELEYQRAWQAGSAYAQLAEYVDETKGELKELLAERREAIARGYDMPKLCAKLKSTILHQWGEVQELRKKMRVLATGDSDDYELNFYPNDHLKGAFCEGAGLQEYPVT